MIDSYLTAAAYGEAEYVDKKSRFIANGCRQRIHVVYAGKAKITIKPVGGFAGDSQSVRGELVFRDACKIYPFALFNKGIFPHFRHLSDGKSARDKGGFYFDRTRIYGYVRFGEQRLGNFYLNLVLFQF